MIPADLHLGEITPELRQLIPVDRQAEASLQEIWNAHKTVYAKYEWGEGWLDTLWETYFEGKDVIQ